MERWTREITAEVNARKFDSSQGGFVTAASGSKIFAGSTQGGDTPSGFWARITDSRTSQAGGSGFQYKWVPVVKTTPGYSGVTISSDPSASRWQESAFTGKNPTVKGLDNSMLPWAQNTMEEVDPQTGGPFFPIPKNSIVWMHEVPIMLSVGSSQVWAYDYWFSATYEDITPYVKWVGFNNDGLDNLTFTDSSGVSHIIVGTTVYSG